MKSAPLVAFDYFPSRYLVVAVGAVVALALIAVSMSGMDMVAKCIVSCIAAAYSIATIRRFRSSAPVRVGWHTAGHWRLVDHNGTDHVAQLVRSVVRGQWIVLNLRRSDRSRVDLILGPDNSDAETRRLLRVRLTRGSELSRA